MQDGNANTHTHTHTHTHASPGSHRKTHTYLHKSYTPTGMVLYQAMVADTHQMFLNNPETVSGWNNARFTLTHAHTQTGTRAVLQSSRLIWRDSFTKARKTQEKSRYAECAPHRSGLLHNNEAQLERPLTHRETCARVWARVRRWRGFNVFRHGPYS